MLSCAILPTGLLSTRVYVINGGLQDYLEVLGDAQPEEAVFGVYEGDQVRDDILDWWAGFDDFLHCLVTKVLHELVTAHDELWKGILSEEADTITAVGDALSVALATVIGALIDILFRHLHAKF